MILLLALAVLPAGHARATTLDEALAAAYRSNPDLQAARRQLGQADERVPQALSGWRPSVQITGRVGRQRLDTEPSLTGEPIYTTPLSGQLQISQPLYRGGSTRANVESAVGNVGAQRERLVATEQDVLFRAVEAYMDVWRDRAVLRLNRNNVRVLRERLEGTRERFEIREVTRTDVAQAESRLARARSDRAQAAADLELSRARYLEVIGQPADDVARPPRPEGVPESLAALVETAIDVNPTVVAAEFTELAARRNVRARTGTLLPQVDLVGSVDRRENQSRNDTSQETLALNAQVTVPLYQSGRVTSQIREAKQLANQRRLQLVSSRRQVRRESVSAWENLQAARVRIGALDEQVEAAEVALQGVRLENETGNRTVLDVLDAEQELLNAQVGLASARRDLIVARYAVLAAIRQLTAEARRLDVELFDPEGPYQEVRDKFWGLSLPAGYDDDQPKP